jgi:hypothetical protein
MSEPRPLHRLFGLSWIDFFQGTSVEVETEFDLSLKQQFIDVVLIRKSLGPLPRALPDGFEDLAGHNLLTFNSRLHHAAAESPRHDAGAITDCIALLADDSGPCGVRCSIRSKVKEVQQWESITTTCSTLS